MNNKIINLLIVEAGGGHGGSAAYLLSFLKYLNKEKINTTVALYNYSNTVKIKKIQETLKNKIIFLEQEFIKKTKGPKYKLPKIKLLKYLFISCKLFCNEMPRVLKLIQIIRKKRIDVVLINSDVILNISAVLVARICGTKCIVRKSGGLPIGSGKIIKRILSFLVDIFIASSNAELNDHILNKLPYKKIITVYEGVDLNSFYPSPQNYRIRKELNISPNQYIIGSISRFETGKGHSDLIKAASLVIKKIPHAIFLIVGDSTASQDENLKKDLQQLVKNYGIEKNFIFLGWREDVYDILQSIDVFVHCPDTWREGMGIATLEAIACGKPTIITANWGLAETTKDEFNGFVIPIGDFSSLSKKIVILLQNNELRKKMGDNARTHAENNFDIGKNVNKIEKIIYESVSQ